MTPAAGQSRQLPESVPSEGVATAVLVGTLFTGVLSPWLAGWHSALDCCLLLLCCGGLAVMAKGRAPEWFVLHLRCIAGTGALVGTLQFGILLMPSWASAGEPFPQLLLQLIQLFFLLMFYSYSLAAVVDGRLAPPHVVVTRCVALTGVFFALGWLGLSSFVLEDRLGFLQVVVVLCGYCGLIWTGRRESWLIEGLCLGWLAFECLSLTSGRDDLSRRAYWRVREAAFLGVMGIYLLMALRRLSRLPPTQSGKQYAVWACRMLAALVLLSALALRIEPYAIARFTGRRAELRGARLRFAPLHGVDLRGANLRDADLREARLDEAAMKGANLAGADLRGAWLTGADLTGSSLHGAKLQGSVMDRRTRWPENFNSRAHGANWSPLRE
jgi:hypothetical protein